MDEVDPGLPAPYPLGYPRPGGLGRDVIDSVETMRSTVYQAETLEDLAETIETKGPGQ